MAWFSALIAFLPFTAPLQAAPPNPEFMDWWNHVVLAGPRGPSIDGVMIQYTLQENYRPSQDDLDRLRAEVKDHPDHPKHGELSQLEQASRREGASAATTCTLWQMDGLWRFNRTTAADRFYDFCWNGTICWRLTPDSLAKAGSSFVNRHPSFRVDSQSSSIGFVLTQFTTAGLSAAPGLGIDLHVSMDSPETWSAIGTGRGSDGTEWSVKSFGTWDAVSKQGHVERVTYTATTTQGVHSNVSEARAWRHIPELNLDVASEVHFVDRENHIDSLYLLAETRSFTNREFESIIAVPEVNAQDVVRGELTYTVVNDYTDSTPVAIGVTTVGGSRALEPPKDAFRSQTSASLRVSGWIVAGCLLITLVVVRLRRSAGLSLTRTFSER